MREELDNKGNNSWLLLESSRNWKFSLFTVVATMNLLFLKIYKRDLKWMEYGAL